jgi:hypothetical protein
MALVFKSAGSNCAAGVHMPNLKMPEPPRSRPRLGYYFFRESLFTG